MPVTLSQKLVLEARDDSADGSGGIGNTWTSLGALWADIRPGRGRTVGRDGVPLSRQPVVITVRGAPTDDLARPRAGQRFVSGTRRFTIVGVSEADGFGRLLRCVCEEERVA